MAASRSFLLPVSSSQLCQQHTVRESSEPDTKYARKRVQDAAEDAYHTARAEPAQNQNGNTRHKMAAPVFFLWCQPLFSCSVHHPTGCNDNRSERKEERKNGEETAEISLEKASAAICSAGGPRVPSNQATTSDMRRHLSLFCFLLSYFCSLFLLFSSSSSSLLFYFPSFLRSVFQVEPFSLLV